MIGLMPVPRRRPSSRWLVYLLRCSDGSVYCGIANDLPKRAGDGRDHSASTGGLTEKPSTGSGKAAQRPAAHVIGLNDAKLAAETNI